MDGSRGEFLIFEKAFEGLIQLPGTGRDVVKEEPRLLPGAVDLGGLGDGFEFAEEGIGQELFAVADFAVLDGVVDIGNDGDSLVGDQEGAADVGRIGELRILSFEGEPSVAGHVLLGEIAGDAEEREEMSMADGLGGEGFDTGGSDFNLLVANVDEEEGEGAFAKEGVEFLADLEFEVAPKEGVGGALDFRGGFGPEDPAVDGNVPVSRGGIPARSRGEEDDFFPVNRRRAEIGHGNTSRTT